MFHVHAVSTNMRAFVSFEDPFHWLDGILVSPFEVALFLSLFIVGVDNLRGWAAGEVGGQKCEFLFSCSWQLSLPPPPLPNTAYCSYCCLCCLVFPVKLSFPVV